MFRWFTLSCSSPGQSRWRSTVLVCSAGALVALALVVAVLSWSKSRLRARAEAWANETVAARVGEARVELELGHRAAALALLQEALALEQATERDEALELLADIQRAEAVELLKAVEAALEVKAAARALELLQSYLDHPHAEKHDRALALRAELIRATSDDDAVVFLRGLPDATLVAFAKGETLPEVEQLADPRARAHYRDTLHRHLPAEWQRREQAFARHLERVRSAPVFRELLEFVALTRRQHGGGRDTAREDQRLLGYLFDEFGVTDPTQRHALANDLGGGRRAMAGIEEAISQKRANAKERFRTYPDFDRADWELFDRAVDWELDQLLAELRGRAPH